MATATATATTAKKAATSKSSSDYTAHHLQVLEGLEAVRKRPGMYIGSTDCRGLMHCLWEIIDNAVDEALGGHCDRIEVVLHQDGSVEVRDNGRGIPVDIEPRTGLTGVEVVFTKLHAGGKFGGGSYTASGGLHGVGASVVNALSSRLDVEVDRGGKTYAMSFRRGEPGYFSDVGDGRQGARRTSSPPTCDTSELAVVGKAKRGVTGTRVRYWADHQIFLKDAAFDLRRAASARARQTSFLVPGLTLVIRDERGCPAPRARTARTRRSSSTTAASASSPSSSPPTRRHRRVAAPGHRHVHRDGAGARRQGPHDPHRGRARVRRRRRACAGAPATTPKVSSFVNIIATPKGGTHLQGFEQALLKVLPQAARGQRAPAQGRQRQARRRTTSSPGLTAVVTVRLAEPQFEGQTKEVLGTNAVRAIVARVVEKELTARLTSTKRGEKAQAALLLEKVVAEMKSRISARLHKETQRRKNALETSSLPAKLADCRSTDVERTELFIVEGDSALGTAKLAALQRPPGAAADPRQDPQRPEGVGHRHAQERRVRRDHPGHRRRLGPHRSTSTPPATARSSS